MIDLAAVEAIDVHVHTEVSREGHDPMPPELRAAAKKYFRDGGGEPTVDDVVAHYRELKMACVVFTVDWGPGHRDPVPNEEIAEAAAANPDVLIPFASVHPARPGRRRGGAPADSRPQRAGASSSTPTSRSSSRTTGWPTRSTR